MLGILFLTISILSSCKKHKIKKNLNGTWLVESGEGKWNHKENSIYDPNFYTLTYTFNQDNKTITELLKTKIESIHTGEIPCYTFDGNNYNYAYNIFRDHKEIRNDYNFGTYTQDSDFNLVFNGVNDVSWDHINTFYLNNIMQENITGLYWENKYNVSLFNSNGLGTGYPDGYSQMNKISTISAVQTGQETGYFSNRKIKIESISKDKMTIIVEGEGKTIIDKMKFNLVKL